MGQRCQAGDFEPVQPKFNCEGALSETKPDGDGTDRWFAKDRFLGTDDVCHCEREGARASIAQPLAPCLRILVDADACPVKDEIYKVAQRYDIVVGLVSNSYLRLPGHPLVKQEVVAVDPDAADDFIAERADKKTIVVTADIPLADRAIKAGASVISPNGKPFSENSIGAAMATRAIMEDLRATGTATGGPPPFTKADRSRFLGSLDNAIVRLLREG